MAVVLVSSSVEEDASIAVLPGASFDAKEKEAQAEDEDVHVDGREEDEENASAVPSATCATGEVTSTLLLPRL